MLYQERDSAVYQITWGCSSAPTGLNLPTHLPIDLLSFLLARKINNLSLIYLEDIMSFSATERKKKKSHTKVCQGEAPDPEISYRLQDLLLGNCQGCLPLPVTSKAYSSDSHL